jgi:hypothetical protein
MQREIKKENRQDSEKNQDQQDFERAAAFVWRYVKNFFDEIHYELANN